MTDKNEIHSSFVAQRLLVTGAVTRDHRRYLPAGASIEVPAGAITKIQMHKNRWVKFRFKEAGTLHGPLIMTTPAVTSRIALGDVFAYLVMISFLMACAIFYAKSIATHADVLAFTKLDKILSIYLCISTMALTMMTLRTALLFVKKSKTWTVKFVPDDAWCRAKDAAYANGTIPSALMHMDDSPKRLEDYGYIIIGGVITVAICLCLLGGVNDMFDIWSEEADKIRNTIEYMEMRKKNRIWDA